MIQNAFTYNMLRHFILLTNIERGLYMKNSIKDILNSLSQEDVESLRSIYFFRCLTAQQLYHLHSLHNKSISEDIVKHNIQALVSFGLIEEVERITKVLFGEPEPVYFLTPLGIEVIRYCFDLPTNIYDSKKQVVKRGYYRASELKLHPKMINHQVHLNQFVIDFAKMNPNLNWKYYDEKYVSQFTNIRPDGMLTFLDTDFFLEMDMGTENKNQLYNKWENYRNFILSREYSYKEKKIIVLFICENTNRLEERINLIKYTIFEQIIDIIDSDLEIYVGTKDQLLSLLQHKIIPTLKNENPITPKLRDSFAERYGFQIFDGEALNPIFDNQEFSYYIRKVNDDNHIVIDHQRIQEFLVDDFSYSPLSILKKIAYFDKSNCFFREVYNRDISYIVIGETEEQIYQNLKLVDIMGTSNVFYTTYSRLQKLPLHQALFQFDFLGNIYHFLNNGLEEREFEKNIETNH